MKNNWISIAFIMALSIGTILMWESPPQILNLWSDKSAEKDLSLYAIIDNAHSRHFDDDGQLSYEFIADTLRHFRADLSSLSQGDYTAMEKPTLTLYSDKDPWYITAVEGRVSEQGRVMTLWKEVRIWQNDDLNQKTTELTTDKLVIHPIDKVVSTSSKVKIFSAQGQLEATGMTVDLNTKQIKLLKQVSGFHEPIL